MKTWGLRASCVAAGMLCVLAWSTVWAQAPAPSADLETLKRMMQEIISENQELKARVRKLEDAISKQDRPAVPSAQQPAGEPIKEAAKEPEKDVKALEERVAQLETEKTANEDAVRTLVRQALSTVGSKINEYVTFGGTMEVLAGWKQNFSTPPSSEGVLSLNQADFEFEIKANDWAKGNLMLQYNPGTDVIFPTTSGFSTGVDRVTVDLGYITLGDPQKFPPYLTAGRMVVPFGISTGNPLGDVLTINNPLTVEVFETKRTAVGLNIAFPTPALTPPAPPVFARPVRPVLFNPLVSAIMGALGYSPPPTRVLPGKPSPATTTVPPLFDVGVNSYNGPTFEGTQKSGWAPGSHLVTTANFQTRGGCGRPYDQLGADGRWWEYFCPWALNIGVNYDTSVFDSQFLSSGYESVLDQIGYVPGVAAFTKSSFGPISLIAEWNGAVERARFINDAGRSIQITPQTWQVTLGYQFDWNPWVESIGNRGTYVAIGFSQSDDLAGFQVNGERVGFVPRRRFLATLGEWVLDDLRFALEYSYDVDYSKSQGGTGKTANGFFSTLTFNW